MLIEFQSQKALETWEFSRHDTWNEFGMVINAPKSKIMTSSPTQQAITVKGCEFKNEPAFRNFLRDIGETGQTITCTNHRRDNINYIDATLVGTADDLRRLREMCKATIKSIPVITAGTMQYEVVNSFRYLGILIGPHIGKKWKETFKLLEAKIDRVIRNNKITQGNNHCQNPINICGLALPILLPPVRHQWTRHTHYLSRVLDHLTRPILPPPQDCPLLNPRSDHPSIGLVPHSHSNSLQISHLIPPPPPT